MRGPNHINERFGRLLVTERAPNRGTASRWVCKCDCGNTVEVFGSSLRQGKTKSCGCLRTEAVKKRHTKHGMYNTKVYKRWGSMLDRCYNENKKWYHLYGGKGITVCDRWHSFENFYADMGDPPSGCTIERIDSNKNYEPENCYWATPKQQSRNTSRNRLVSYNGETKCVAEWAEEFGIPRKTLMARLNYGWTPAEALEETPRVGAKKGVRKKWTAKQ